MATENLINGAITLNDKTYDLRRLPIAQYVSKQVGQVNVGDASYAKLSTPNWIITDQRGGIGIEEMDESVHGDRYWWGDCITDYKNHLLLPRKATAITAPSFTTLAIVNGDMELDTGWTGGTRSTDQVHGGTYSRKVTAGNTAYQELAGWNSVYQNTSIAVSCWAFSSVAAIISINDGVGTTNSSAHPGDGAWHELTVTRTLNAAATKIRLQMTCPGGGTSYFDDFTITYQPVATPINKFVNFNGNLYHAAGNVLLKLNSGRTAWTSVASFSTTITDLIPSLNSRLYILLGDSTNYYYMSTAEACTQSDSANANWGFQWDNKLFKVNTSGQTYYSTDPDGGSPTWTADATFVISDIASQISSFFIGKDADGNDIPYCATKSWLLVMDFTNKKWVSTALKLPEHPNGGKGACYWHGAHYNSYGLGVKQYVSGSTATISEVGLNKDDGLPTEYNGEIVKFSGDSGMDIMFALVDASQVTGTNKSGLYAFSGKAWRCWWADTANDEAMHDVIVSAASSGYAVYWDVGGVIYYIDIPRGITNPTKITMNYATSGVHITSWFDAGTPAFNKSLALLTSYAKNVTTTETITIKYRTDRTNTDLSTGWTTLDTLNATGDNNEVKNLLASGAGLEFNSIQIRFDLARGSTATLTPDLQSFVSSYELLTGADGNWVWTLEIPLNKSHQSTAKEKKTNLDSAIQSTTLVPLKFREGDASEPHYVRLHLLNAWQETGHEYEGVYVVQAVKL